ncbi:ankyrin repeat domain-containing protein [Cardinium endosymbiont of Culicoides punctatus]|uniref:ankyrin repeat domain-containing protein n=1 Tax=Cardinium endosymbiont of Culicoides punctatus TaxID=2304601 RepID=UPI0010586676|nr:ankyrin repeat domain-containing protein [Cardinium endosymbiont of Culicoides punctatus]TDG95298.1 hypothetical protein CCPUN_04900 [Cardinium endosymbiont of Culicoides punctatus]
MKYIYKIVTFLAMVWVTTGISKCTSIAHRAKKIPAKMHNILEQKQIISDLKKAIKEGDELKVEALFKKHKIDPNLQTSVLFLNGIYGMIHPLYMTILYRTKTKNSEKKEGYLKIIKFLLKNKADPSLAVKNPPGSFIEYPLTLATWKKDVPVVQLLLDHGANVNQLDINYDDNSPDYDGALHAAMKNGDMDILNILLKNPNIDVNLPASRGMLPLQAGIYGYKYGPKGNQIEAVKLLLANPKTEINKEDRNNKNASLNVAVDFGCIEIVESLVKKEGIDMEHKGFCNRTPLGQAVHNGNVEIVKLLLKHGANPKAISIKNALLSKLGFGKHKEIKKLLKEAKQNS